MPAPGDGPLVVDNATICEVHGSHKQGACYGYTHRLGYHLLLVTRADGGEVPRARLRKGAANTARGILRFVDELVARLRHAGATTWLDADHRRHAVCELAIRDLKAGAGWRICPRAGLPPTRPGCWLPPWPTICCAGRPGSAWASVTSRPSPRRCAVRCLRCPAGYPLQAAVDAAPTRQLAVGPLVQWRWLGCTASPTRPDRTPTPPLASSTTHRRLRPARHGGDQPTKPLTDQQSTLSCQILRPAVTPLRASALRDPTVRKPAIIFADR